MMRLRVHVEGQTEESFVNTVLAPYLYDRGYESVDARILGNARQRGRRGGIVGWDSFRKDVVRHLKSDIGCIHTTMVDYYGMPSSGRGAWPGRSPEQVSQHDQKGKAVEVAMAEDLRSHLGNSFNPERFVPFVVMHEFEGLLFSNCKEFATGINQPEMAETLQRIRDQFDTPEEINDDPDTAPSKRIRKLVPGYQKPLLGVLAAVEIGIDRIVEECPHFRSWIHKLEDLGACR